MKHLGKLAAATSTIALLLACGAAAAQAESVSLCKQNEGACAAANQYPKETALQFGTATATIKTKAGEIECKSQINGDTTAATSEPTLPGEISGLSMTNCVLGATKCTVTAGNLPYRLAISKGAGGNGTFTITGRPGFGSPGFSVVCGAVIKCTMAPPKLELPFTSGVGANLKANAIVLNTGGEKCPAEVSLSAQWAQEAPATAIFISS